MKVPYMMLVAGAVLAGAEPVLPRYHEAEGIPAAASIRRKETQDGADRIVGGSPVALGMYPYLVRRLLTTLGTCSIVGCFSETFVLWFVKGFNKRILIRDSKLLFDSKEEGLFYHIMN